MADRIFLSNDSSGNSVTGGGIDYDERTFTFAINETSVHGAANMSATMVGLANMPANGKIVDVFLSAPLMALSASGFVSGTVTGAVHINSALCLATNPSLTMQATSAATVRLATNNSGGVSAVLTAASCNFSTGDQIAIDWNTFSTGSAAAGAAGKGLYLGVRVRYAAY